MLGKLLPIIFLVIGVGGGIGAGLMLKPAPEPEEMAEGGMEKAEAAEPEMAEPAEDAKETEFTRINNQFVVPIIKDDRVMSQIVVSLSLETELGLTERIYVLEPKLRDTFLRVLFDHANMGGFRGVFTSNNQLDMLRRSLTEAARQVMGEGLVAVLIVDIARQDT